MGRLVKSDAVLNRARRLRSVMTEHERLFWFLLRDRRFAQWKFRRQVPLGDYVVDFVCFRAKLVVELDGEQHKHPEQAAFDAQRAEVLQSGGFRVIRFWNGWLNADREGVMETLLRALQNRTP